MTFDEFWAIYPRKVAKEYARLCWGRKIKTVEECEQMKRSLPVYLKEWLKRPKEYIPHAGTFINKGYWKDRAPVLEDAETLFSTAGEHLCTICSPPHAWPCADEACGCTYELACPDALKKSEMKRQEICKK